MTKPPSITRFEQFYWGSVAIGLLNAALNWQTSKALLAANPVLANAGWILPVTQIVGLVIAVLLWFFIARRPSVVAKWIQVVFAGFSVLGLLRAVFMLAMGRAPLSLPVVVGLVASILYIAAAVMLFKPDAKAWFGEGLDEDFDELDSPRV